MIQTRFKVFRCLKFDPAFDNSAVNSSSQLANLPLNQEMWAVDQDDWGDENQDDWGDENQEDWGNDDQGDWDNKVPTWSQSKGNNPPSSDTNFSDAMTCSLDAYYSENNAETTSSSGSILPLNNENRACSQVDSSSVVLHSSTHVELPKAMSQVSVMKILSPC